MNRRSYVVLAGSFLTTGCIGTGPGNSTTPSDQPESEGYSILTGGIVYGTADTTTNPPTVPQGKPIKVKLRVSNQDGATTSYTVAVQLQQYKYTESDGDKTLKVVSRQTLTRSTVTVEDGERKSTTPTVTINETGKNYRLMFFMYKSNAPYTLSEKTASDSFVIPINITSTE